MVALLIKNKNLLIYGVCFAMALFILKWLETRYLLLHPSVELYSGGLAVLFMLLGVWVTLKLRKPKTEIRIIEKEIYIKEPTAFIDQNEIERTGLSKREREVLQLMAEGLSNQEIAGRLFVSLNTVKTHASKLFEKMDVKRRTQAVEKAKRLNIIS